MKSTLPIVSDGVPTLDPEYLFWLAVMVVAIPLTTFCQYTLVWMGEATTVHSSVIGWAMSTEYKLCFTVTVGIAEIKKIA